MKKTGGRKSRDTLPLTWFEDDTGNGLKVTFYFINTSAVIFVREKNLRYFCITITFPSYIGFFFVITTFPLHFGFFSYVMTIHFKERMSNTG